MVNSKKKGSRIELEVVNFLKEKGVNARRTAQYCGNSGDASDIVVSLPHPLSQWHLEVKGTKSPNITYSMWCKWLDQVKVDSHGKRWVIFHKPNDREIHAVIDVREKTDLSSIVSYPSNHPKDFTEMIKEKKCEERLCFDLAHIFGDVPHPGYSYGVFFKVRDSILLYMRADDFLAKFGNVLAVPALTQPQQPSPSVP